MNQISISKMQLPLIRLSLVTPFIEELERRSIDSQQPLLDFSLAKQDVLRGDMFVPAPVMYGIVEKLAAVSGDPHLECALGKGWTHSNRGTIQEKAIPY